MMIRYLTTLLLTISLLTVPVKGSCEQETTKLNNCTAGMDDCKMCVALGESAAWTSCSDLVAQACDALDQCGDSCGSCMEIYKEWATCYAVALYSLPEREECQLTCGGRMEETTSNAPFLQHGYFLTFLLAALV